MNSGEGEFELCCESIAKQTGLQKIRHFVVSGLKEAEAHNSLWDAWESEKVDFDLFVKVDADTILQGGIVSEVWQKLFRANDRVTGAQLSLYDYFTNTPINGLNFFSPQVKFNRSSGLHPDRVDTNHDIVLKGEAVSGFAFGGTHCRTPTERQAFHFGFHRAMKNQHEIIQRVYDAWRKESTIDPEYDKRKRSFVLGGAHHASNHYPKTADYDDGNFEDGLIHWQSSSVPLRRMIIERHFSKKT